MRERFGPAAADIALTVEAGCLHYRIRGWTVCGIPLPSGLGPKTVATEACMDGRFCFDVALRHALLGLIVRYRGALERRA